MEGKVADAESKTAGASRPAAADTERKTSADDTDTDGWQLPGLGEDGSVVARASVWLAGERRRGRLSLLAEFARDNCHVFEDELNSRPDDGSGLRLEYEECHRRFLQMFEDQMERFVAAEGFTMADFETDCEAIQRGKSVTLFEHEDHKWFLEMLLSTLDYEHFHAAMVAAAKQAAHSSSGSRKTKNKK